jgi:biotin carboxyl carrier protein
MKVEVRILGFVRAIEIERIGPNQFRTSGHDGDQIDAFEVAPNTYSFIINGHVFDAVVIPAAEGAVVRCRGREFVASIPDRHVWQRRHAAVFGAEGRQQVTASMPGKVVRILVSEGATVEADQGLIVVEAMKMQNEIRASRGGKVERIFVREGQAVAAGEPLVTIH